MEVNFESYKIQSKNLSDTYSVKYCARHTRRHKYVTFLSERKNNVSTKNNWRPLRKEEDGEKEQDSVGRINDTGIQESAEERFMLEMERVENII